MRSPSWLVVEDAGGSVRAEIDDQGSAQTILAAAPVPCHVERVDAAGARIEVAL